MEMYTLTGPLIFFPDAVDDEDNDNNVEMPDTSLPTRTSLHQLRQVGTTSLHFEMQVLFSCNQQT